MVFGQTTFGTVTGQVKDATGAVISGAVVTISNQGTNVGYKTTTSSSGVYIQPNLLPGTYSISVADCGWSSRDSFQKSHGAGELRQWRACAIAHILHQTR
jgi:hypothetical protein